MTQAAKLRTLLAQDRCHIMPCCFDALSAKLIQQEGYDLTFMSGFATSASRIGQPDLGLMSYGEILDSARNITDVIDIPLIGDGDTGYGNAMNVRRTVTGFAKAGCAAIMIEDQLAPKRCGHTPGKAVVSRDEAFDRIQAAVDARE
ncbi:MAG: isocitrate lyase/PEP mutase family protein, partial [Pseudomonadota bacterium]